MSRDYVDTGIAANFINKKKIFGGVLRIAFLLGKLAPSSFATETFYLIYYLFSKET